MKVEVRCGSCHRGFLVDERETSDLLSCPACLTPIASPVQPPAAPEPEPAAVASTSPISPIEIAIDASVAATAPTTAPTTADDPAAIVCPRCKLHFDPASKLARRQTPDQPRQRVLVVEDLEYFRQVASDALSTRYEVVLARNAAEGRAALAEAAVQLIIVDLELDAGDDGRDFLRSLQPKPCPILVFTAQDESEMYGEHWDQLRALGADDVVIKGMRVAESLERKVDAMLGMSDDEI